MPPRPRWQAALEQLVEGLRARPMPVRIGVWYRQTSATRARGLTKPLLWVVVALLAWGVVMVYSASLPCRTITRFGKLRRCTFAAPCDGFGDGL